MKRIILFVLLVIFADTLFAQSFSLDGKYAPDVYSTIDYFAVNEGNIIYKYEDSQLDEKIKVSYKKVYKDGLLYFQMPKKFPYSIAKYYNNSPTSNTLLVLAGECETKYGKGVLFFAETTGFEQYDCFITSSIKFEDSIGRQYQDCSSSLKEKNREYKVEDLCDCKPGTPWVEGVPGSGIGEGFTIKNEFPALYENPNPYLLIMNGYISYDKPYLYKQNNRIKKIKVTGAKSGKSKILDVLDTPHPQTVDISFITEPEDIRVEIADVYKGTKYDDTCINFCVTYYAKVVPYEDKVR